MTNPNNSIRTLGLSARSTNLLLNLEIYTIEELLNVFYKYSEREFCQLRRMGPKSYKEIADKIRTLQNPNFANLDETEINKKISDIKKRDKEIQDKIAQYDAAIAAMQAELEENRIETNKMIATLKQREQKSK